jgi:acetylornithine aminotransferase
MYLSAPQVQVAEKLVNNSSFDKAFFCNSGTEANEAAIKFSRKFHYEHGSPRQKFIAFENSFHGRTMGALALTWKEKYKTPFQPLMQSAEYLKYNDASMESLKSIDETTCAVFVEPVQGEGGCIPGTSEFLTALRKRCDEVGALLVFDEVQCGLGRTGNLFAYELSGVLPDIVTLAKPIAGGLPMGGCLLSEKLAAVIKPGDHGSTFAGGALVCAAADYTISRIADKDFLANVSTMGTRLREGLRKVAEPHGCTVRGEGLLNGIVCPTVDMCTAIQKAAQDHGLVILTAGAGNVLRLAPALTVTPFEVDLCIDLIQKAFADATSSAA